MKVAILETGPLLLTDVPYLPPTTAEESNGAEAVQWLTSLDFFLRTRGSKSEKNNQIMV